MLVKFECLAEAAICCLVKQGDKSEFARVVRDNGPNSDTAAGCVAVEVELQAVSGGIGRRGFLGRGRAEWGETDGWSFEVDKCLESGRSDRLGRL